MGWFPELWPGVCGVGFTGGTEIVTGISAITLATHNMACAVAVYEALGFVLKFGGPSANFTSFRVGNGYLNLMSVPGNNCGVSGAVQPSVLTT